MANDTISIKEDAAPTKKLASQSFVRGVDTVHQEEIAIGDGTNNGRLVAISAANALKIDGSAVTQPVSDAAGSLTVDDGAGSLTVDAIDLDIRNLGAADVPDLSDRAARDCGKIDVASLDQYTPVAGRLPVDGSGVTQPISAAALPLPAGAATSALQLPNSHDVTVDNAAGAAAVNIQDGGNTITVDGTVAVAGTVAHDAVISGNPVSIGGATETPADSAPANRVSAEGDLARVAMDPDGSVFVLPHGPQIWTYHEDSSSALTDASVHAAPGAGLSLYVTDIVVSTGAATALNVFFEEGSTKVLGPFYLEAVAGRGLVIQFRTPKKITANTALTVTTSAAIAHSVEVQGYIGRG